MPATVMPAPSRPSSAACASIIHAIISGRPLACWRRARAAHAAPGHPDQSTLVHRRDQPIRLCREPATVLQVLCLFVGELERRHHERGGGRSVHQRLGIDRVCADGVVDREAPDGGEGP